MRKSQGHSVVMLLRLRRQREDCAKQAMILASAEVLAIQKRISLHRESLVEYSASARQSLLEGAVPVDMETSRRRIGGIRNALAGCATELKTAQETFAHRRFEMAQAIKQRRALEFLEKKLITARVVERNRRDQKELDEIYAVQKTVRHLNGEKVLSPVA